jgi:hypothetical protein
MNTERPTLDKLLDDLETAKNMALEDRHINGMITATLAQAKLLGLDKPAKEPAQQIDVNVSYVRPLPDNLAELSATELAKLYFEVMQ